MRFRNKWSEIMVLEIQEFLDCHDFYSNDMTWKTIGEDRIAMIPYSRLENFIAGEEMNADAPCHFVVKQRRSNDIQENYVYKASAFMEYAM
eukprot:Gb_33502 [translate_table: standard]